MPKDAVEFGPKAAARLNAAGQELVFLLNRGYDTKSASTFVGNHHLLSERQRLALARMTSPHAALEERERKRLREAPESVVLDGFNTIITLEVALSGSLLLEGMDGTVRDLAGLRGNYRIVDKTVQAVELLLDRLVDLAVKHARFYLDRQVSNSGRLRALLLEQGEKRDLSVQVELDSSVDGLLSRMENVITADAIILDRCGSWYNLNRPLIRDAIPQAWVFRLENPTEFLLRSRPGTPEGSPGS